MKKTLSLLALVAVSGTAFAQTAPAPAAAPAAPVATPEHTFTGNVTLASEYLYRAIAQTNHKPAIQGGFDYTNASGFYAGTWGSSISWLGDAGAGSFNMEWDLYGGYKTEVAKDTTVDVGVLKYYYPGKLAAGATSPDTLEVYGAVTYSFLTAKISHSTSNLFGTANSRGSDYFDLTGNWDLGEGWAFSAHVGHQTVKHTSDGAYTDYKLGVTKDMGAGVSVGAAYLSTNAKGGPGQFYHNAYGKDLGASRLLLTLTKTL